MTYWQFLLYSKYLLLIMTEKVYWRVFFDHTFDLLNQFLLSYIRFSNSLIIPYLSFFLPIRYHQKAIQLSIRSQRRKRCKIILTREIVGIPVISKPFLLGERAFLVLNAKLSMRKIIIHLSAFIVAPVVAIVGFVLSLVVRAMFKKAN